MSDITPEAIAEKRFLIIDDFDQFRQYLRQLLRSIGATQIEIAQDGKQAIELLQSHHYDVIYCDYNLGPGSKDGQQLLEEARQRRLINELTIFIMVTVENAMDMVMGAMEFRPNDYLAKPFNKQLLRKRLVRQMEHQQVLQPLLLLQRDGNLPQAIELCDLLAEENPHYALSLQHQKGMMLLKLDRYGEAISLFQSILYSRPIGWAQMGLAESLYAQGDLERAEGIFTKIIRDNPSMVTAYDYLAQIKWRQEKLAEAEAYLLKAVNVSPKKVQRQEWLARIALQNEHIELAESAARAVISYATNSIHENINHYARLATIQARRGDELGASETMALARRQFREEGSPTLKLVQANLKYKRGDLAGASAILDELDLLSRSREDLLAEFLLSLADTELMVDRRSEGKALLERIAENHHDDDRILEEIHYLFRKYGMDDEGRDMVERVKQRIIELNNHGVAMARKGNMSGALQHFRGALEKMPNNVTINVNTLQVLFRAEERVQLLSENIELARTCMQRLQKQTYPHPKLPLLQSQLNKILTGTATP